MQRAAERISECFQCASGGEIVASGEKIEDAICRDKKLQRLLERAHLPLRPHTVDIFREDDVLKSELLRALLREPD
jgi:hypothetical protein